MTGDTVDLKRLRSRGHDFIAQLNAKGERHKHEKVLGTWAENHKEIFS